MNHIGHNNASLVFDFCDRVVYAVLLVLAAAGKEVLRNLREGDVAEHVLLASCGVAQSLFRLFVGVGGESRGVASLNGLFAAEYLCAYLGVDGGGGAAVLTAAVSAKLSALRRGRSGRPECR